jgi:hypothetical protein
MGLVRLIPFMLHELQGISNVLCCAVGISRIQSCSKKRIDYLQISGEEDLPHIFMEWESFSHLLCFVLPEGVFILFKNKFLCFLRLFHVFIDII